MVRALQPVTPARSTGGGGASAATLGGEYFRFREGEHAMVGDRTGTTYRLGDEVTVRLVEAAPMAGALRFEMMGDVERPSERGRGKRRPERPPPRRHGKARRS